MALLFLTCIFLSFVVGAIFSVISFVRYGNFLERMTYLFSYLKECFLTGHFQYYYSNTNQEFYSKENKTKIHFAIPIFFSVLLHVGGVF